MSYKIVYRGMKKKPKKSGRRGYGWLLTLCFFVTFVFLAHILMYDSLRALRQMLFQTIAVDTLLQDLIEGSSVFEAVGAFWKGLADAG